MRLNIKKVSAIAASALMVGLTIGGAVAVNYPQPFVVGGTQDAAIVYGTGQGASYLDVVQAGNIEANLQSYMSAGGGSSTTSVSGGDSKILSSSIRKLYYGDGINAAWQSLSYTEMPNVLTSGTVTDLSGTAYGYTQTIKVGNSVITYGTSGGDLTDPTLYLDAGNSGALTVGQIYNYTLSFTKSINVSDATNVQGQKIRIQGIDYVIGSGSTNSTLYLYGSGVPINLNAPGNQSINVGGTPHTVEMVTTTSTNAIIRIDGVSKTVVSGSNYAFAGGINVYVKTIINPSYAGDLREVDLLVGASSLQLISGQTVKKGADGTSIQGTSANITAAGVGIISGFTVSIGAQKTQNDSIALGQTFVDPVFGGIQVTLANVVPNLDPSARSRIVADAGASNTQQAAVTFTSARSGSVGEKKIYYVYDNNTASTAVQPLLAGSTQPSTNSKGIIHVLEGENARVGDYIVVNQGDAGTMLYVQDMYVKDASTGTVILTDAITGDQQTLTVTNDTQLTYANSNVNAWGGTGYTVNVNSGFTLMNITWSGASLATARSVYPRIKLANGGWLAFLTQETLGNGTKYILPDGQSALTTTGTNLSLAAGGAPGAATFMPAGINWTVTIGGLYENITGINNTNSYCNFNSSQGPALLYMEPKKWNDQSFGDFICIPLTTTGTTQIAMGDPVFNGTNSGFVTYGSDTYKKAAVDTFGTWVIKEDRQSANGVATLYTAPSQMSLDVVFAAPGVSISGGTVTVSGAQLGDILVTDSNVASVSQTKNLIVVGGSCINSVAAQLVGGAYCGSAFTTATNVGSGQFLIKSYPNALSTGNIALLVAGYEAADTVAAATYLRTQPVDTSKTYTGTTQTMVATQVTSS